MRGKPALLVATIAAIAFAAVAPAAVAEPALWTAPEPITGGAARIGGEATGNFIAFTFDDGPHEPTTPAVLDALAQYQVPATFFVVTKRLRGKVGAGRRELLARIRSEGHLVGSHTVSHPNLSRLRKKAVVREIDRSLIQLTQVIDAPVGMFRAPFGAMPAVATLQIKKRNLTEVRWSLDSKDFKHPNPTKLRARVKKMFADGGRGVILFHDTKRSTAHAIGGILEDLEVMNCARLAAKEEPVLPVSIHYFLRDGHKPRAVPEEVQRRTQQYRETLNARCLARQTHESDQSLAQKTPSEPGS